MSLLSLKEYVKKYNPLFSIAERYVMKNTKISLALVVLCTLSPRIQAKKETIQTLESLYKKISNGLVVVRKDYPGSQKPIYMVLDQLDQLYNTAKITHEKKKRFKQILKTRNQENATLHSELIVTKSELDAMQQRLNIVSKNFIQTQTKIETLTTKNKELLAKSSARKKQEQLARLRAEHVKQVNGDSSKKKINNRQLKDKDTFEEDEALKSIEMSLENGQSLNLTSTSEPNSPL